MDRKRVEFCCYDKRLLFRGRQKYNELKCFFYFFFVFYSVVDNQKRFYR